MKKVTPETRVVDQNLTEIKFLAGALDPANADKLVSDFWELESKISALKTFILNHILRKD